MYMWLLCRFSSFLSDKVSTQKHNVEGGWVNVTKDMAKIPQKPNVGSDLSSYVTVGIDIYIFMAVSCC